MMAAEMIQKEGEGEGRTRKAALENNVTIFFSDMSYFPLFKTFFKNW